jgi:hypothetical protein
MANNRTLTAADAILMMTVDTIYPAPFRIKGFAADDVTNMDAVDNAETSMGVDGRLSAGFVFRPLARPSRCKPTAKRTTFSRRGRSMNARRAASISRARPSGHCHRAPVYLRARRAAVLHPDPRRAITLQPRSYVIEWESVAAPAV